jgi:hypothetical protein
MARNAMTSLLSYFTIFGDLAIWDGSNPGIWTPSIWRSRVWTPQIWRISGSGPPRSGGSQDLDPLDLEDLRIWTPSIWRISGSGPPRSGGSQDLDPWDLEDLRIWTPQIWRSGGSRPLRSWIWPDLGYPILGGPLKHPDLAYLRVFSLFHQLKRVNNQRCDIHTIW